MLKGQGRSFAIWALGGGLAFGIALNIRVDVIFVLPGLAVWIICFAKRPYQLIGLALLGMLPGVLLSSGLNWYKFGTMLPFSYGREDTAGRGDSASTYVMLVLNFLVLFAVLILIRHWKSARRPFAIGAAVCAVGAALFYEPMTQFVGHVLHGIYVLGFDLRALDGIGEAIGTMDHGGGVVTYYGVHKKALVQSMPWLFLIPFAFVYGRRDYKGVALVTSICLIYALPFAMQEWHGGKSNSLRYFLVLLPFVSFLAAFGVRTLIEREREREQMTGWLGAALAAFLAFYIADSYAAERTRFLLQYIWPNWLFGFGLISALLFLASRHETLKKLTLLFVTFAAALSAYSTFRIDMAQTAVTRLWFEQLAEHFDGLPAKTLLYSENATGGYELFRRADVLVARPGRGQEIDWALIDEALAAGYWLATDSWEIFNYVASTYPSAERLSLFDEKSGLGGVAFRLS
ncbi:hypothetical protein LA304_12035 [Celeribacter sp. ASW11-22]|nr:hypothetical protein [Celeribacter litoreus]